MTTKITVVQCRGLRSALNSHSRAALGTLLWLADSADWRVTAVRLDAEAWALSHFLCRLWSKSPGQPTSLYSSVNAGKKALISFLTTSRRPRGGLAKNHPRGQHSDALSLPTAPAPISTIPLNQGELLHLLPSNLCLCLQDPPKKHTNPCVVSCSDSDGINIAWYLQFCLFKWGSPALWELWCVQWVYHFFTWRPIGRLGLRVNIAHRRRRQHCAAGCCVFTRCCDKVENCFYFFFSRLCLYCSDGLHRCITPLPRTEPDACFDGDKIVALIRE